MNEIPGSGFYKSENYKTITTANGEILAFREVDNEIDSVMTKEEAITILCAIDVPEGNNAFIDKKAHQAIQMAIDALSIEYASDSSEIPKDLEEYAFQLGYEVAEKDILALIESRLSEIIGDAQPKPALRAELEELIKRIKQ